MDAFYASAELLRRPELKGQPVVIAGIGPMRTAAQVLAHPGRGVVTTATYEARAFGVHSAMPTVKAARLCPDCIFLPVDFSQYRRLSQAFKEAVRTLTPEVEDRGIDEIYIDLTDVPGDAFRLAQDMQQRVFAATGLTCSIGITPNKLLSKMASEFNKPRGITVLGLDDFTRDLHEKIWPLPAKRINGIGPKADMKLAGLGIVSIGDLAAADPAMLIARFGKSYGAWMHEAAHGRDARPVVTISEPKSRSRETTFEDDLHPKHDWNTLAAWMVKLSKQVAEDLKKRQLKGRTIGIKIRTDDFKIITRDKTLATPTDDEREIRKAAFECFQRTNAKRRLRLIGVRVMVEGDKEVDSTKASPEDPHTMVLFE
jgi:DNA polymerase IV